MHRVISSVASVSKLGTLFKASTMGMSTLNRVSHVIFDMDGLLLDTEHIYEGVVRDIAKSFGKDYPLEVRMKVMGTNEQMTGKIVVEDLELPIDLDEFLRRLHKMCNQRFNSLALMPGAERLIKHLHVNNVPFALATSSGKESAEIKMNNHPELFKLFHHKVMGSTDPDVLHGKPAPDIFLIAAKRFQDQPDPSRCLVFEDAPNGVKAAVSAGMQAVMVPDKIVKPEQRKEATVILDSLNDFRPEIFGLPKFESG